MGQTNHWNWAKQKKCFNWWYSPMLLKFVNLLFYWKTKNTTLFLGYILGKQTHSKWAKQKKGFKLMIRRPTLLKFVNLFFFYWKPKKPTLFTWTFLEKQTFQNGRNRGKCVLNLLVFFLCEFLFYAKKRFPEVKSVTIVSNYWSGILRTRKLKIHPASIAKSSFIWFNLHWKTAQIQG